MKLNQRDQKIVRVLLPLLVVVGYWHFWLKDLRQEHYTLHERLSKVGSQHQLQAELTQLNNTQRQLRQQVEALPQESATAAPVATTPWSGSEHLQRLQELLQARQMRLISATAIQEEHEQRHERQLLATTLAATGTRGQYWRIVVEANYGALLRFLQHCAQGTDTPVVESLVLPPGRGDDKPAYWSLVICW